MRVINFAETNSVINQYVAEIRDVQGSVVRRYEAESDAMVLYMTVSLAVKEGTPLVAYG